MTAEAGQESSLPRGCTLTKASGLPAFVGNLVRPIIRDWTPQEWDRRNHAQEES